jgi:predicted transposase YbfD/YdcC
LVMLSLLKQKQKTKEGHMESTIRKALHQSEGLVFDLGSLFSYFAKIKDKRKPKGLRYPLPVILTLIVLAKLCGQDRPSGIAEWAQNRAEMLVEALSLKREKMPHHSTYRRILEDVIDISELESMISQFLKSRPKAGRSAVIVIDGKTLRGTIPSASERGVHLLSAYLPAEKLVLGQIEVGKKENEISAAPRLLSGLNLAKKIVTGDAMHTQREVSMQIYQAGGDYVWFVKENHPRLRWDLEKMFEPQKPIPGLGNPPDDFKTSITVEKDHGRIEVRRITVSSQLKDYVDWPYLEQAFKLDRRFTYLKSGQIKQETVYGITSLPKEKTSPEDLLAIIGSEWGIENGLHYRRDVTFQEDRIRMTRCNAGRAMAAINNLVIGLLAFQGYHNFASARRWYDAHPTRALNLIRLL